MVPVFPPRAAVADVGSAALVKVEVPPPASNDDEDDEDDDDNGVGAVLDHDSAAGSPAEALALEAPSVTVVAALASSVTVTELAPLKPPSPAVVYEESDTTAAELSALSAAASAEDEMGLPTRLHAA